MGATNFVSMLWEFPPPALEDEMKETQTVRLHTCLGQIQALLAEQLPKFEYRTSTKT